MKRTGAIGWPLLLLWAATVRAGDVPRVVHSEPSAFGRIYVVDEGDLRYLRYDSSDGDDQSVISISDPMAVPMDYVRDAAIALTWVPSPRKVLMIGLGAGTFTTFLFRQFPELKIDAVEINPVVVRVARDFFRLPEDPCYRIHTMDGRRYLEQTRIRYDLVFVDAYTGEDELPAGMSDHSFFALLRSRLTPGGVTILNLSVDEEQEAAVQKFFERSFPSTLCLETADTQNLLLIGLQDSVTPDQKVIQERAASLDKKWNLPFKLSEIAGRIADVCVLEPAQ